MTTQLGYSVDPKAVRRKLGLNQQEFWSRIGVTQSGGSRYESGRRMPKPVLELLRVVHVERIDLSRVNRADFDLIELLKTQQPEVYAGLLQKITVDAAQSKPSATTLSPQNPAASKANPAQTAPAHAASTSAAIREDFDEADYEFLDTEATGASQWSDDRAPAYEETLVFQARRRR